MTAVQRKRLIRLRARLALDVKKFAGSSGQYGGPFWMSIAEQRDLLPIIEKALSGEES